MRLLVQHQSTWTYPSPAALGPHLIRLRPANHTKASIETYGLTIGPSGDIRWQQDPHGNNIARITYPAGTRLEALSVGVEFTCDIKPVNPFDFFVDDRCKEMPFAYPAELTADLAPFLDRTEPSIAGGPALAAFLDTLPRTGDTVHLIVALNEAVNRATRYVIREEAGIWGPERTVTEGRGSCRDSAVLLIAALRSRGLAARLASGYLIQLADEGMIPGAPRGVAKNWSTSTHGPRSLFRAAGGSGLMPPADCSVAKGTFRWPVRHRRHWPRRLTEPPIRWRRACRFPCMSNAWSMNRVPRAPTKSRCGARC